MSAGAFPSTIWDLRPSLKYDALCLLNVLGNDPYYLTYYRTEFDHFDPLFTLGERTAFRDVKRIIKDEARGIVSALLALELSVTEEEGLAPLIRAVADSSTIRAALEHTSLWDPNSWTTYERARPSLLTALQALERVGFESYWEENVRPVIEKEIEQLRPVLPKYDIVPAIEAILGKPLPSHRVVVYLLQYSQPHGIRITGTRFLTHVSYPFEIVLRNAIHELMHPPYDSNHPAVRGAVERLGADATIREIVEHHNKSFGYNTVPGYVEEDCVQALEEIVSRQFGAGRDPVEYWKMQDDGMHTLAAAIYEGYRGSGFEGPTPLPFPEWFVGAVSRGALEGEQLLRTTRLFFEGGA